MNNYPEIQELLQQRADLYARLNLLAYDGTPEIKENKSGKYLYVRKRVGSRVTSTYVDVYSDTLYQLLLRNNAEAKDLRKQIRKVEKALADAKPGEQFQFVRDGYYCKDTKRENTFNRVVTLKDSFKA